MSWNQSSPGNEWVCSYTQHPVNIGNMEFQDHLRSDPGSAFPSQPPAEFDRSSGKTAGGPADPYCSVWNHCKRSFATDARLGLEGLTSGYNSASPRCFTGGVVGKYGHPCDKEDSQEEESILDSVELLDVEAGVQDDESWLYQASKKTCDSRSQSALGWCRHVLDHPSAETEAACRSLRNKLQRCNHRLCRSAICSNRSVHRCPALFHRSGSADSSMSQTAGRITASIDSFGLSSCSDSPNSSYKLQDITDVHVVARMQEASLRHDYISAPASRRGAEPLATFPSYFDTSDGTIKFECGSTPTFSSFWKPGVPSSSPSYHSLLSLGSKYGCQSPKLSRLQQQVTKFKLLKLAQSQETTTVRTRSPLRTSLRSLQAVRNSRSFDTDDHQPADSQIPHPQSGAPADKSWSPSLSGGSMRPLAMLPSVRDPEKRLERSQSASPCRIPHAPKGHLSINGRVFASPERRTTPAWALGGPSNQREKVSRHEY